VENFQYVCGGLLIVGIIIVFVSNYRQDKKLRAAFLESRIDVEEVIAKSIRKAVNQPLVWTHPSSGRYALHSGSDLLAQLYLDSYGGWIGAVTDEGKWIADSKGLIALDEPIGSAQSNHPAAQWHTDTWHGRHTINFANGRIFNWKRVGPHGDLVWTWLAGLLLRATTWVLTDERDERLVWFKNYRVGIEEEAKALSELSLLVLLGTSMMISIIEHTDIGG
jgi:hypothetical protein